MAENKSKGRALPLRDFRWNAAYPTLRDLRRRVLSARHPSHYTIHDRTRGGAIVGACQTLARVMMEVDGCLANANGACHYYYRPVY